jgi:hypothetical protein
MSSSVFPTLPGLQFPIRRASVWEATTKKITPSKREFRLLNSSFPRYRYTLTYEFLRSAAAFAEYQTLFGFYDQMGGDYDTFKFTDSEDSNTTLSQIGVGNGSTTKFQLARTLGGATVPIFDTNGTPQIYKAGTLQVSGYSIDSNGVVTFSTAPTAGQVIAFTGSYYWRCRFEDGSLEVEQFMAKFWKTGQIKLITCKP